MEREMKVRVVENEHCFAIDFKAVDMIDAALLTRLGANATREIRHMSTTADAEGNFKHCIVLGRAKYGSNDVPNRNRKPRRKK